MRTWRCLRRDGCGHTGFFLFWSFDPATTATVIDAPGAAPEADQRKLLLGLIGSGIQRSLAPSMHEEEARHHGLRLHYQLIDLDRTGSGVEHLPALIAAVRTMRFDGLNITCGSRRSFTFHSTPRC